MKQIRRLQGEYSGMEEKSINIQDKNKKVSNINLKVLTFPEFSKTNMVSHLFSTRTGGCSRGIFRAMNLGFNLDNVRLKMKYSINGRIALLHKKVM